MILDSAPVSDIFGKLGYFHIPKNVCILYFQTFSRRKIQKNT